VRFAAISAVGVALKGKIAREETDTPHSLGDSTSGVGERQRTLHVRIEGRPKL
jgi:hypothetical protein